MSRRRLKKNRKKINVENLAPKIREGYTEGLSKKEALEAHEVVVHGPTGTEIARYLNDVGGERVPTPRFHATDADDAVVDLGDGRKFRDAVVTHNEETTRAIQAGHICLRCKEPHPHAFPEFCDLCGYPMKERQVLDFAMEFEGNRHIGPSKPMQEYLDEQTDRVEKRKFIRRVLAGGQGKIPRKWLADATLLEPLSPEEQRAIRAQT